jgi:hypothetical protein
MQSSTAKSVFAMLRQYMRDRDDIGTRKALCAAVLEPANPFDPRAVRQPQRWFVLFALLAVAALGCLIYFNSLGAG